MKKITLLIGGLMIQSIWVSAQNVGVNTLTPLTTFHVELGNSTTNGVLFTGDPSNETNFPSLGAGNRFMFYPARGALRAGFVGGTQWDNFRVGVASTALGINTIARSGTTFATNYVTTAGGSASSSFGSYTITKGYSSMVIGTYNDSLIVGADEFNITETTPLFMIGNGDSPETRHNAMVVYKNGNLLLKNPTTVITDADSFDVPAIGSGTRMMWIPEKSAFRVGTTLGTQWSAANIGTWSFAGGVNNTASGDISFAMGYETKASGALTTTLGYGNIARGFSSTVVGMFNNPIIALDQADSATATTPLFIVGNGDDAGTRRNAMIVRKDGHVGIGTSNPITSLHMYVGASLIGGFLIEGIQSFGAPVPALSPGSRMSFFAGRSAIRAGKVEGNQWDDSNMGTYSAAFGLNTTASGNNTMATGESTMAIGTGSTSMGKNTKATGTRSFAIGENTNAIGSISLAMGLDTRASGHYSVSSGQFTIAKSYAELAIGRYNDTILATMPNSVVWESNDALFVAGNGTGPGVGQRHNAFVIYKNGDTEIDGNANVNGNTDINGFTHLGNSSPNIKMKKLTGTSAGSQGSWTDVAHGLTSTKILSVDVIMLVPGFVNIPPSYTQNAGYQFNYHISSTNIVVVNSNTNSFNILSRAFTILITYEE